MIARNVNFAGRESKIIDWYENVPKAIDYYDRGDGITRLNGQMVSDFKVTSLDAVMTSQSNRQIKVRPTKNKK